MTDLVERLRGSCYCTDREGQCEPCNAADEITRLRAQVETLDWQLTMESIDTTCHCAAKSSADCGCPGAVWPEDRLRARVAELEVFIRDIASREYANEDDIAAAAVRLLRGEKP